MEHNRKASTSSTRRAPDFVKKLFYALETASLDGETKLRWAGPGQFEIIGDQQQALNVLQRYDLHFNMFSSFVRQLSYYNFKRLSDRRRSDSKDRPIVPLNIRFGHPSPAFSSGNAEQAFAVIARKSRNRSGSKRKRSTPNDQDRETLMPSGSSFASPNATDRIADRRLSTVSTFSINSFDSQGSEYDREECSVSFPPPQSIYNHALFSITSLKMPQPTSVSKPSFIHLVGLDSVQSAIPSYPSPLSPNTSPCLYHALSGTESASSFMTPHDSTKSLDSNENPFSHHFGQAIAAAPTATVNFTSGSDQYTTAAAFPITCQRPYQPYVAIEDSQPDQSWSTYPGAISSTIFPSNYSMSSKTASVPSMPDGSSSYSSLLAFDGRTHSRAQHLF